MRDVKATSKRLSDCDRQLAKQSFQQYSSTSQHTPVDLSMDSAVVGVDQGTLSDLDQLRLERGQLIQRTLQQIQRMQSDSLKLLRAPDDEMEEDVAELGLALRVQIDQESPCEGFLDLLMQLD